MSPTTKKNNSGVLMRRASCSGWFADRPPLAGFVSGVLMLASFVGDLVPLPLLACAGADFSGWSLLLLSPLKTPGLPFTEHGHSVSDRGG
jgi:hypothetical protein